MNITTGLTDIRCKTAIAMCGAANAGAGADYVGEVRASMSLRLTDRLNGTTPAGGTEAGTVQDSQFAFNVPCVTTTSTAIGGQCSITTSANAVTPGFVKSGVRSLWQLGSIQVFDGGADGQGLTTGDNQLFMDQGVFTP